MGLMDFLQPFAKGYFEGNVDIMTARAKEIERANYDMTLAMWEKRLFGKNSYTDITIPPLGK